MIYIHADDFGINQNQSRRILECSVMNGGALNSVSVMPNSAHLIEAMPLLEDHMKKSIHINLAEGACCCNPDQIPLLQRNGVFYRTFGSLFMAALWKPKKVEEQCYKEIYAQIQRVISYLGDDYKIRIDSHVHYHMIPAVFRGLCRALSSCNCEIEYIRVPDERLSIYLTAPGVWKYIRPVNFAKMVLVRFLSILNRKYLIQYGLDKKTGLFFGLSFTNEMVGAHVKTIYDKYAYYAKSTGKD